MALCQEVKIWHEVSNRKGIESKKEKDYNMQSAVAILGREFLMRSPGLMFSLHQHMNTAFKCVTSTVGENHFLKKIIKIYNN